MVNVVIHNPAPVDRQGWVEVIIPADLGATAKFTSGNIVWPGVRGRQRYPGAYVYRIKATMTPNQIASGTFVTDAAPPGLPKVFALHPWVGDDLNALMPTPAFPTVNDPDVWNIKVAETLDQSLAHQTVHIRRHNPLEGMIFELYLRFLEDDPCVEVYGAVIWSTRKDPALVKRGEGLFLGTKELFALDTALRLGASPASYMGAVQQIPTASAFIGEWKTRLTFNPGFQDGGGYAFSGRLCCFVGPSTSVLSEDPTTWGLSVSSLKAGQIAPMVAICTQWGTGGADWLTDSIPRIRGGAGPAATIAASELLAWANLMAIPSLWNAARPIGATPAYVTGSQEDHGRDKGCDALAGLDPKWILQARHSAYAEFMRGGMNYEDIIGNSLHLLLASEHPQWHTWNGYTHYSPGQSPDRIGKKNEVYGERASATGWEMQDDQHYSRTNINAYRALTDDPLFDLRNQATVEIDTAAIQDNAARAYGRQLQVWADEYALAVGNTALQNKILANVDRRLAMANSSVYMNTSGPMKVLSIQNDPRKVIFNLTGEHAPSASMFEHGLAAIGFARWQGRGTASASLQKILTTLALYACWKDTSDNTWYVLDDIWYQGNGTPPDPSRYFLGSPQMVQGRGGSVAGGATTSTLDWTFTGILLAAKLLPPGAARTQAADCVAWWTGNQEATARNTAEFWSVVDAIPVVP
jgi:hypothetical protein